MKQGFNKLTVLVLVSLLVSAFGFYPPLGDAQAINSLKDASDLISDSDPLGVNVTHDIRFMTASTTGINGFFSVRMPNFSNIQVGNVSCPATMTASTSGTIVDCIATAPIAATSTRIVVRGVTNPAAGSYINTIYNYASATAYNEWVQVRVMIVDNVWMTARVDATLNFVIAGLNVGEVVNGVTCTATSTATTTPFGTLSTTGSTTVCQQLTVATNADDGYSVTVEQDQELTSDSGSNINSFDNSQDGTGSTTPHAWAAPANLLDQYNTYGHMGLTSEDASLSSGDRFGTALYVGFNNTNEVEVMYHNGPSDGTTPDKGLTQVAYTTEIKALQEAGDYESTLTYICTPVY